MSALGTTTSSALGNAQLSQTQFLNLLVAQLKNQDPGNPLSSTDFITQLSQLTSVQSLAQLDTNISSLLQLQGLSSGSALIGKTVQFTLGGAQMSGTVSSVQIGSDNQVNLIVGKNTVPLSGVSAVS